MGLPRFLPTKHMTSVQKMTGALPPTQWALRQLAALQLADGEASQAVVSYQAAVTAEPRQAALWEGLGAAYHAAGRHTAALKVGGGLLERKPRWHGMCLRDLFMPP